MSKLKPKRLLMATDRTDSNWSLNSSIFCESRVLDFSGSISCSLPPWHIGNLEFVQVYACYSKCYKFISTSLTCSEIMYPCYWPLLLLTIYSSISLSLIKRSYYTYIWSRSQHSGVSHFFASSSVVGLCIYCVPP